MPCVSGAFVAASLPVVGLPVPEQQVSEPVPRWQREHILLQFHHGPPPLESGDLAFHCKIAEELDPPRPPTPPPASPTHTPTWLLFRALYSKERLTTRTLVHLMASPNGQEEEGRKKKKKKKHNFFFFCVNADLLCPRAAATGRLHPSACGEAPLLVL